MVWWLLWLFWTSAVAAVETESSKGPKDQYHHLSALKVGRLCRQGTGNEVRQQLGEARQQRQQSSTVGRKACQGVVSTDLVLEYLRLLTGDGKVEATDPSQMMSTTNSSRTHR